MIGVFVELIRICVSASLATRIAAAAVIGVAFVDSQLTFCSMQTTRPSTKKKLRGSHEQVSDIEYIIPRVSTKRAIFGHRRSAKM